MDRHCSNTDTVLIPCLRKCLSFCQAYQLKLFFHVRYEIYYFIDAHDVAKVVLNMSNPVFQESSASSKIITVIKELRKLKVGSENIGMAPIAHGLLTRLRVRIESLGLIQKVPDCQRSTGLVQDAHSETHA